MKRNNSQFPPQSVQHNQIRNKKIDIPFYRGGSRTVGKGGVGLKDYVRTAGSARFLTAGVQGPLKGPGRSLGFWMISKCYLSQKIHIAGLSV